VAALHIGQVQLGPPSHIGHVQLGKMDGALQTRCAYLTWCRSTTCCRRAHFEDAPALSFRLPATRWRRMRLHARAPSLPASDSMGEVCLWRETDQQCELVVVRPMEGDVNELDRSLVPCRNDKSYSYVGQPVGCVVVVAGATRVSEFMPDDLAKLLTGSVFHHRGGEGDCPLGHNPVLDARVVASSTPGRAAIQLEGVRTQRALLLLGEPVGVLKEASLLLFEDLPRDLATLLGMAHGGRGHQRYLSTRPKSPLLNPSVETLSSNCDARTASGLCSREARPKRLLLHHKPIRLPTTMKARR